MVVFNMCCSAICLLRQLPIIAPAVQKQTLIHLIRAVNNAYVNFIKVKCIKNFTDSALTCCG